MYITKKPPHTKYDCNQLLSICDWIDYSHIEETHVVTHSIVAIYTYLLSHSQENLNAETFKFQGRKKEESRRETKTLLS